jgi:hypothetical protein
MKADIMRRKNERVSARMPSHIIDCAGRRIDANAALAYRTVDPYAVALTIRQGPDGGATWLFARELLTHGLHRPVGDGDVIVAPGPNPAQDAMLVGVRNGTAGAVLELARSSLSRFLRRTYGLVPTGREVDFIDISRLTMQLCPSAAGGDVIDAEA